MATMLRVMVCKDVFNGAAQGPPLVLRFNKHAKLHKALARLADG